MVLPNSHRVPRVPWYLGTGPRKPRPFRLQDCHLLWWVVPDPSTRNAVGNFPRGRQSPPDRTHNPATATLAGLHRNGLGSSHFARRYSGNHGCFLFLGVLRCFTSPRSPRTPMYSVYDDRALPRPGCPIRTSPDQSLFSGSPKLFAANRVLLRLSAPRHPPSALSSLTIPLIPPRQLVQTRIALLYDIQPLFGFQRTSPAKTAGDQSPVIRSLPPDHPSLTTASPLVEVNGFEPMASCVQGRRSPS